MAAGQQPVRDAAPEARRTAGPPALDGGPSPPPADSSPSTAGPPGLHADPPPVAVGSTRTRADADDGLLRGSDLPWIGALAGSLVVAASGPGLDEDLARETSVDPAGLGDAVADAADVAGSLWLDYGAAAGTFAISRAAGWSEAGRVALRALIALAVTDAATAGLKVGFGRTRPRTDADGNASPDADRFDVLSFDEQHRSLPSGHAARAFALASTLDRELGDGAPWLPWVAYPAAALTGVGRVLEREHWATDAVAGAALGLLTSRVAGRLFAGEGGPEATSGPRAWVVSGRGALALGVALRTR